MALTIYQYPNCSTCKKAIGWLKANGVAHTLVDIVKAPPNEKQLASAQKKAGVPVKKLFNVSGESYRAGGYKDKLATMTDAQAIAALAKDGKLIKRPLAVGDSAVLVGFDEAAWKAALA
ncbi:MAG TPA: arsenate reductase family protein [Kofleriaceae bacterium]